MFGELRARHGLLPETTFMIGDKLDDLGFAANAGLSAGLLVLSGKGAEHARKAGYPEPVSGIVEVPGAPRRVVAADFESAVAWIVRDIENRRGEEGLSEEAPSPSRTPSPQRLWTGGEAARRRTCRMCGAGGIESPDVQSGHKKEPCVAARLFFMCSAAGSGFSLDQSEADEHFPEILP
ncbi:MAG: HAD hydrolase-like protein [Bilophila wadsworthia]